MRDQLINSLSGKLSEPQFTEQNVISKVQLIKSLSWYSSYGELDKLKAYAISFLIKNDRKEVATRISSYPDYYFKTYGALCRMIQRGAILSDFDIQRIYQYFETIKKKEIETDEVPVVAKPKVKKQNNSTSLDLIDKCLDDNHTKFSKPAEDKTSNAAIKKYCENIITSIKLDVIHDCYEKRKAKIHIKFLESVITNLSQTKVIAKVPKKVSPLKLVHTVKFCNESIGGNKSIHPLDILNKRKMYVFDKKTRKLMQFIAVTGGFTFKGTTLLNYDTSKSVMKTVRNPDEFFQNKLSMTDINKKYNEIKYGESAPKGRFNENMIILMVS